MTGDGERPTTKLGVPSETRGREVLQAGGDASREGIMGDIEEFEETKGAEALGQGTGERVGSEVEDSEASEKANLGSEFAHEAVVGEVDGRRNGQCESKGFDESISGAC